MMVVKDKRTQKSRNLLKFTEVKKSDCKFLYELLKERNSSVNISHKHMPSYTNHINFVISKPYSKWYIVKLDNKKIGSTYLSKQNDIGIFLKKQYQREGVGKLILDYVMKKNPRQRFLANINPKNKTSIKFFKKNRFKLIQYTYELIRDP